MIFLIARSEVDRIVGPEFGAGDHVATVVSANMVATRKARWFRLDGSGKAAVETA